MIAVSSLLPSSAGPLGMSSLFTDSPEFLARKATPYRPPNTTIAAVHAVVPKTLLVKSTPRSLAYILRDIAMAFALHKLSRHIDSLSFFIGLRYGAAFSMVAHWSLWIMYWNLQGLVLAGCWVLCHDLGHGALFSKRWMNHLFGYLIHTPLLVPYFSWRLTHQTHHKNSNSVLKDGSYVPRARSFYGLPAKAAAHITDYHDVFEDTPVYVLCRVLLMQFLGWPAYLLINVYGEPNLPPWTNHFNPSSLLFKPEHRRMIIVSNVGVAFMALAYANYIAVEGFGAFLKSILVPYFVLNHWIVMLTFLHHTDPTIPHYRNGEWTFLRGALATVDRPLLGWAGRFFLHNVSHDHIAHHFFTTMPFYNLPEATKHIKVVLGEDYNYDSTNCFRALYRNFTQCCFIEDDEDIAFYKNRDGQPLRMIVVN